MKRLRPHLLVLGLVLVVLLTGSHHAIRNWIADARFALFPREATGAVVLVAIDSGSLDKVGVWPWPRRLHAEIIGKLHAAGASEIAFDVDFSSTSDHESDRVFVEALRNAGGSVVLPSFKQWTPDGEAGKRIHYTEPLAEFGEISWPALVNVPVDPDGLVRRYPYGERVNGSFVASLAEMLGGQSGSRSGSFFVDYSIQADSIPTISFVDVLHGNDATLKRIFSNKKAIIGATALELGDRVNLPRGQIVAGVVLQALAVEAILQGRTLQNSRFLLGLAGALGIAILMFATWGRASYWRRAAMLIAIAAVVELGAILLQAAWPFILDTSILHLAVFGYVVVGAICEIDLRGLLSRIAERRFQRIAMSVGDGLICVDRSGQITFWNPGAVAMFGYEPREILGKPIGQLLVANSGAPAAANMFSNEILESAGGNIVDLNGRRRNGELFPVEARLFGWEGANGIEYGALVRDISARKRHLERIQHLAQVDTLTGLANRHT